MSGHSKWSTIKRKKGAADAKRGKIFTKLIREIATAARIGGGELDANPRLRLIVDKAKAANMPKDNIARAIAKGVGGGEDSETFEECVYEGYGPGGVAILIEALTDNRNRAAANVRAIFSKNGGNLGETGAVSFMFDRVGQIVYPASVGSEDKVMEAAIESGAEDVESDEDTHTIYTAFEDLSDVAQTLEGSLGEPKSTAIAWRPKTLTPVEGEPVATLMKLIDALEDDDDVQNVYGNYDISDEDLETYAG